MILFAADTIRQTLIKQIQRRGRLKTGDHISHSFAQLERDSVPVVLFCFDPANFVEALR